MNSMQLYAFAVLLGFQLLGELLSRKLSLPVPGPVLGLLFLAMWYLFRRKVPDASMEQLSRGLLMWLGLLFVPAGVGIVTELAMIRSAWLPLLLALIASTLVTLLLTAGTMHLFARTRAR